MRQALRMDGVGVGADVVASSLVLEDGDGASGRTQQPPADPEPLVRPDTVQLRPSGPSLSRSFGPTRGRDASILFYSLMVVNNISFGSSIFEQTGSQT